MNKYVLTLTLDDDILASYKLQLVPDTKEGLTKWVTEFFDNINALISYQNDEESISAQLRNYTDFTKKIEYNAK